MSCAIAIAIPTTELRDDYFAFLQEAKQKSFAPIADLQRYTDEVDRYFKTYQEKYYTLSCDLFDDCCKRFQQDPSLELTEEESLCCENVIGHLCWAYKKGEIDDFTAVDEVIEKYMDMKGYVSYREVKHSMSIEYDYGVYYAYIY
jgi:hypothetical protein